MFVMLVCIFCGKTKKGVFFTSHPRQSTKLLAALIIFFRGFTHSQLNSEAVYSAFCNWFPSAVTDSHHFDHHAVSYMTGRQLSVVIRCRFCQRNASS